MRRSVHLNQPWQASFEGGTSDKRIKPLILVPATEQLSSGLYPGAMRLSKKDAPVATQDGAPVLRLC